MFGAVRIAIIYNAFYIIFAVSVKGKLIFIISVLYTDNIWSRNGVSVQVQEKTEYLFIIPAYDQELHLSTAIAWDQGKNCYCNDLSVTPA